MIDVHEQLHFIVGDVDYPTTIDQNCSWQKLCWYFRAQRKQKLGSTFPKRWHLVIQSFRTNICGSGDKQDNVLTLAFLNLEVIWLILPISLLLPSVGSPSDNTKSNFFSLKVSLSKISILPFQEIHITKYQNVKNIKMFSRNSKIMIKIFAKTRGM